MEGTYDEELRHIVADIKETGLDITEEWYIEDYQGVNIYKVDSDTYHL